MQLNEKINLGVIRVLSRDKNEPEWFLKKRLEAFKAFNELLMPELKYGINIKINYDFDFNDIKKENSHNQINIENPSKKIIFESFDNAFKHEEKIMKEYLLKLIPENKFNLLNTALLDKGFLIYVPNNIKVKKPVKISSLLDGNSLFQHILIILGENSKLKIIEDNLSNENDKQYCSKIVEIFQKENSELDYFIIQNLKSNVYNFSCKKADLDKNAILNLYEINLGSKLSYSETITELNGKYSKINNYGIFIGDNEQQFDIDVKNIHNNQNTSSNISAKGALFDNSKAIYHGLIKINRNASYSNGYQKEDTLLLSKNAEADSIPELEIDNSEVKCTHASTVSHLDKEKLFYLMSRGLDKQSAEKELTKGFFNDLINKFNFEEIENIKSVIFDKIK